MELKPQIILVDDSITNLSIGKNALGDQYTLLTVPSGEKLFRALAIVQPNLILLDVDMPGMDGYEILSRLKHSLAYAKIPVIFLSARDDADSIEKGFSLGAADFVTKPYLPQHLNAVVKCHLLMQSQRESIILSESILANAVNEKKQALLGLQNAILSTLISLAESRGKVHVVDVASGKSFIEKPLIALTREMMTESIYKEELLKWDPDLFMTSAHFHDIGKIIVKDHILLKPSKLTPTEFDQMKKHTVYGVHLIESIEHTIEQSGFFTSAKLFANSHHERWDGSGYPIGLHGDEIPLQGRLMAIIDVYNALISERPYKKPVTPQEAREIIAKGRGTHFDPRLTDIFLSLPIY